ncbi:conserved hypothetical protein [Thermotomaculum hydrothermale]|uniref:DUF1015 domain-containing protein n=1 Tax=Thermotomaculum hydrothermale TaxID=981385 RepID=A0A7R6PM59_9BACT|nr:DUF1015 family protein [Thermotomaculum hydrothermale]BBB32108.1 conserved hypothetical protein [Thermotomaculum hydrothermale]
MVRIKPFRGVRPQKEYVDKIASPPYDVVNTEEARELAKDNPLSFLHVVRPEIDLDPSVHIYDERVYQKAKENLEKLIKEGYLVQDGEEYLYVYRQQMGNHIQTGLVACAWADDYFEDRIKKHEFTREDKEKDRIKHVYTTNANTGPVFLTYKAQQDVDSIIEEVTKEAPEYHFTSDDGVIHTFWVIRDKKIIDELKSKFEQIPHVYIADGHHRSASGAKVREWKKKENPNHTGEEEYNYFLAVYFPHNQLQILPYNRAVKDLNGLSKENFLKKVEENFNIEKTGVKSPSKVHEISMYLDGEWYTITPKSHILNDDDPVKSLDVYILQEYLLAPILGIENPRKSERITFVGGIRGTEELEKLVNSGDYAVAFSMYPTTVEQLMNIADAGQVMPPKSTWFEPKLRSGLIVHLLD